MQNHNIKIQEIIEIAKQAGNIAMQFYDKKYTIEQKQNKTPVTEADIAINDFLMEKLSKYNYPILSEEVKDDFDKRKNADFVWIIDPLDGTSDFIQKTGEFSIMIGLVNKKGESVLGVVYAPALDELYYAEKNKGTFLIKTSPPLKEGIEGWLEDSQQSKINKKSLRQGELNSVQERDRLGGGNMTKQFLKENSRKLSVSNKDIKGGTILVSRNHLGQCEQKIAKKHNMKQIPAGSAGLKICWITRGNAELYMNSSSKSGLWDTCAADIILRESGGNIFDTNKSEILYNTKEIMLLRGYITSNKKYDL